jgi:hypothetical protein
MIIYQHNHQKTRGTEMCIKTCNPVTNNFIQTTQNKQDRLREIFASFFNITLDAKKQCGLPLVQLAQLIELEEFIGESVWLALLNGLQ